MNVMAAQKYLGKYHYKYFIIITNLYINKNIELNMKKINFKEFPMKIGIASKEVVNVDIRESFADVLYSNQNGIKALTLAQKIYKSEGETEFEDEEFDLIKSVAEQNCVARLIDSINSIIDAK